MSLQWGPRANSSSNFPGDTSAPGLRTVHGAPLFWAIFTTVLDWMQVSVASHSSGWPSSHSGWIHPESQGGIWVGTSQVSRILCVAVGTGGSALWQQVPEKIFWAQSPPLPQAQVQVLSAMQTAKGGKTTVLHFILMLRAVKNKNMKTAPPL